jgi:hypothetical protein
MGVGAVFVVVSFQWLSTVQHWLGDAGELTPLVILAMFVAVVGIATGLIELPIRLLRLLLTNKQREAAQKQGIKVGIQEVKI